MLWTYDKMKDLELVKEWVTKRAPSFFSPNLEYFPHIRQTCITSQHNSTFFKVFIIGFMSQFKRLDLKFLSFIKIPILIPSNIWGISANVNNYFGPFATHSFTNHNSRAHLFLPKTSESWCWTRNHRNMHSQWRANWNKIDLCDIRLDRGELWIAVESWLKKTRFKKDSRFMKDCCHNHFWGDISCLIWERFSKA